MKKLKKKAFKPLMKKEMKKVKGGIIGVIDIDGSREIVIEDQVIHNDPIITQDVIDV